MNLDSKQKIEISHEQWDNLCLFLDSESDKRDYVNYKHCECFNCGKKYTSLQNMWHHKADCTPFALPDIPAAFSNGIQRRKPVHALKGSHQYIQFVPTNFKLLPQDFFIIATDILNERKLFILQDASSNLY